MVHATHHVPMFANFMVHCIPQIFLADHHDLTFVIPLLHFISTIVLVNHYGLIFATLVVQCASISVLANYLTQTCVRFNVRPVSRTVVAYLHIVKFITLLSHWVSMIVYKNQYVLTFVIVLIDRV